MNIHVDMAKITSLAEDVAEQKCADVAVMVSNRAKRLIHKGARTGKIYKIRGKKHRASAPGEPPANDTGELSRRINPVPVSKMHWKVVSSAEYAILEYGTAYTAARPYMRPAAKEVAKRLKLDFEPK